MPRPSNTAQRRAQIIDGMLTVMATEGYERASIQAIARAANLTPGLLHYHFGSKEKILLAVLETIQSQLIARYVRHAGEDPSPQRALDAWIDAHLALDEDADPRLIACWVQLGATALRMPSVGARYRVLLEDDAARLQQILTTLRVASGDSSNDTEAIAASLMSAVAGAYQLSLAAPRLTPPGSAATMVKRMSVGLLQIR